MTNPRTVTTLLAVALLFAAAPGIDAARAAPPAPPPLPSDRLHFGVANQPDSLGWLTGSGVPWRYRYTYLSGGVNTGNGWETWQEPGTPGLYASRYLDASHGAGYIPVFSYYMLLQSAPSAGADEAARDYSNLNNTSTMNSYYADFKVLMQRAGLYGGPVVVQVEPDLWGFLQQHSSNTTADRVPASVNSSGNPDTAGLPDTAQGFADALLRIRDRYGPNVQMAIHASPWSSLQDIGSSTDPGLDPVAEAAKTVTFLNSAGIASNPYGSTWDVVFNDVDDHDAAWWEKQGKNHWWDPTNQTFPNFSRYLAWVSALHTGTARPQVTWQVPDGNQYFLTENNTCGHYQDNVAAYFLAHPIDLFQAGVIAVLFGAGNGCQTTNQDSQLDGITNNNGVPTDDAAGWCSACNTHVSQYPDDDGGFLRIFVGQYYGTVTPPAQFVETVLSSAHSGSYHLDTPNDGGFSSWVEIDPTLRVVETPTSNGSAVVSANLDLWTAQAGYNQDIGIFVSTNHGADTLVAWKESGGFAGTFSPNAAFVQAVLPVLAGSTYLFKMKWKPNKSAPGQTIYAGAGVTPNFSPSRLTIRLVPSTVTYSSVQNTSYHLDTANDGGLSSWVPVDPALDVLVPGAETSVQVSANMDLWTAQAGYNQDLGLFVSTDGGLDTLLAWKESGGFAGTYSPNAAFVTTVYPTHSGHSYTFKLKWKPNKAAPGGSLYGAAGTVAAGFSPTRVTVEQMTPGASGSTVQNASYHIDSFNSGDFGSWVELNPTDRVTITPAATGQAVVTANMDLWTSATGYNQDLAIFSCDATAADCTLFANYGMIAWKESGGFAGNFSPNAATVQTAVSVTAGHGYTFALGWKANHSAPAGVIYGGAGAAAPYSPTTLIVQLGS